MLVSALSQVTTATKIAEHGSIFNLWARGKGDPRHEEERGRGNGADDWLLCLSSPPIPWEFIKEPDKRGSGSVHRIDGTAGLGLAAPDTR